MRMNDESYSHLFNIMAYVIITSICIVCVVPLLLIISGSFTSNSSIIRDGFNFIPNVFSYEGYSIVFRFPDDVLRAYGVTIFTTVAGTTIGMFFMTMAGYILQRKDFKYRSIFSFYIYFTTLFGGGLVPWYIMLTRYLKLTDTYTVLIFPGIMMPFLIILMRSFIKSAIPDEMVENARVDGANDFKIYYSIVLHMSMPGIATVGLFLALQYWNDWFLSSLFINDTRMYQLQYYLYNIINSMTFINQMALEAGISLGQDTPTESTKMAMTIVVTGPIIFLYPFVQRYFIKGLIIGAVKG